MPQTIQLIIKKIEKILTQVNLKLTTAESCTGGLVAEKITMIPNSSLYFERGFITYSNMAKIEMLGVKPETLEKYGAVSEQVAYEMATGAVLNSHAQISIAITGIAGPKGGTKEKPVGTVCFAWSLQNKKIQTLTQHFQGTRKKIRSQAAEFALYNLLELITTSLTRNNH